MSPELLQRPPTAVSYAAVVRNVRKQAASQLRTSAKPTTLGRSRGVRSVVEGGSGSRPLAAAARNTSLCQSAQTSTVCKKQTGKKGRGSGESRGFRTRRSRSRTSVHRPCPLLSSLAISPVRLPPFLNSTDTVQLPVWESGAFLSTQDPYGSLRPG